MAVASLEVLITGDSTGLTSALNKGAASTRSFQSQMSSVGSAAKSALGSVVPLGAAAAGAAVALFAKRSIDAATDFSRSFTQIDALTNVTTARIGKMQETVLSLAGETAQAPNDLAHAYYFLASAGLTAQQQTETLRASAEGAAVGLGDAADIARITANALNAFADQGLTATQVTDTLVAAVREGTAEPQEFATALGRVLPIADAAGISFQQVAASLAVMSNAGLDVNEGVTALRGALQALVAPTQQTQDALANIGLTVDDVVASMQQHGLLDTLRLLQERAAQNTDTQGQFNILLRQLVPNVRALTGVLNLTGQAADKVDGAFKRTIHSAGDLEKAWGVTQQSDAFRLSKAMNDISIAGQDLALKVLPKLATALTFVVDHATELFHILEAAVVLKVLPGLLESLGAGAATAGVEAGSAVEPVAALTGAMETLTIAINEATVAIGRLMGVEGEAIVSTEALAVSQEEAALAAEEQAAAEVEATAATRGLNGALLGVAVAAFGAYKAFQSAKDAVADLGTAGHVTSQFIYDLSKAFNAIPVPGTGLLTFAATIPNFTGGQTEEQMSAFQDRLYQLKGALDQMGLSAKTQTDVVNKALATVGGKVTPDNIDQFAGALRDSAYEAKQQADAVKFAAEQADKADAAAQRATERTNEWQHSIEGLTSELNGLSFIGIDANSFVDDFREKLANSKNPMQTYHDELASIADAAQKWTDQAAETISNTQGVIQALSQKKNLGIDDITNAFNRAAAAAKTFVGDLANIAKQGPHGKELANALLQLGPEVAGGIASTIAGASEDAKRKAIASFGSLISAGQSGAEKLQHAIVPVLQNISDVVKQIALQLGVPRHLLFHVNADKKKADKDIDEVRRRYETLRRTALDDPIQAEFERKTIDRALADVQHKLDVLVQPRQIAVTVKNDIGPGVESIQNKMAGLIDRYGSVALDVGVHTHPKSPWPDEALKMHLFDPLARSGFKKINGMWTLPISIATHTDVSGGGFGMGANPVNKVGHHGAGGHEGGFDTIQGALKSFRKAIADAQSPMYAKRWQREMLAELKKPGRSDKQRLLFKQAIRDVKQVTTPKEARDAASAFHDAITRFEVRMRRHPKHHPDDWKPVWYDAATKKIDIPVGINRPDFGRRPRLMVSLDRKKFDEDLSYETTYRGWT